ncbi:unnamed protein product, partial [Anisakis simplex]|uniref:Uncharacterized protein n=1 Tax=Anisakis simplex TaxID=6269 RepID=A0A0M3JPU7_ANISI
MKPSSTAHRTHLEKTSSNSSNSILTPSGLSAPPVHETTSEPATVSDDSANRPSRIPVLSACSPSPSSLEPSGDLPSERIASVPNHSPQKTPPYPKELAPELSHCQENQLL